MLVGARHRSPIDLTEVLPTSLSCSCLNSFWHLIYKEVHGTGQALSSAYFSLTLWHKLCRIHPPKPIGCWHSPCRQISKCSQLVARVGLWGCSGLARGSSRCCSAADLMQTGVLLDVSFSVNETFSHSHCLYLSSLQLKHQTTQILDALAYCMSMDCATW